eukprot:gene1890-2067_t
MSRFWAAASSSEDERSSASEASEDEQQPQILKATERKFAAAFDDSDSESEDEVRVVKSQKDKAWEGLQDGVTRIRNARRNGDWPQVQDEFANVNKMLEKNKNLVAASGVPNFYIKMLAEVEDGVQAALKDKDALKRMKPVVTRALNQMKLQVKKHNDGYKEQIADLRANPDKYAEAEKPDSDSDSDSDSDDSDSDSDSDSDGDGSSSSSSSAPKAKAPVKKVEKKAAAAASDSESDDSLFGDDESEDSSSSEDERQELKGRARWLKKAADTAAVNTKDAKKEAKKVAPQIKKEKRFIDAATIRKQQVRVEDKMTEEELDKKVRDLVSARGRKGTDAKDVLRHLEVLTKAARLHGARKEIPVQMHLISAMFDSQRGIDDFMDHHQWLTCYRSLLRVMQLLENDKSLYLVPLDVEELVDPVTGGLIKKNDVAASAPVVDDGKRIQAPGSVSTFLLRLQEEYTKSVQHINPHTKEYVERLADEEFLIELADLTLGYYQRVDDAKSAANVALLVVESLYYKHEIHAQAVRRAHVFTKKYGNHADLHPACRGKTAASIKDRDIKVSNPASWLGNPSIAAPAWDLSKKLEDLCSYIFVHGDERNKTRALLCSVFHHALHDRYYRARDLLLVSRIQDFIDRTDVRTQILYNRTIVTIGLCAFRLGMFKQAHECLSGIVGSRAKEFLAQGSIRSQDRDLEQERLEKRRQMPYHMHVNPDLLECCHLVSAMILELPLLAKAVHDPSAGGTHVISKQLRRYLETYNNQVFAGPPETTREHVMAATKSILEGDWKRGYNFLAKMDVWNLLPGEGGHLVKQLLMTRIQEEAIRCYLLVNADYYDSISLAHICEMFGLEQVQVKKVICRMIFNKDISAAWEPESNILVMYRIEPSKLQHQALSVIEKVSQMLESNERIIDSMVDVYGYKDDWNAGRGGDARKGGYGQGNQERRNRNYGVKNSQRPIIARNNTRNSNKGNSRGGGQRNAWNNQGGNNNGNKDGNGGNNQNRDGGKYRREGNNGGNRRPHNNASNTA